MPMNSTLPRMEPFVISEVKAPRLGIYAEVYKRLLAACNEPVPQGLWVAFPSASASNSGIKKMQSFACEDGYCIRYHEWDGQGRRLHLEKNAPEE